MHHGATSHRRSVCAPRAIKNPFFEKCKVVGRWRWNEKVRRERRISSQCSEWHPPLMGLGLFWICGDRLRYETIHFHLVLLTNPLKYK